MTPQRKQTLGKFLAISTGLVVLVGGVSGALRWAHATTNSLETKTHADSTYVRKDSLDHWKSDMARRYSVDSTARLDRDERIDTSLAVLVRACRRRGECP